MQPAWEEVVQKLTVPASTATASCRLPAIRSFPSWRPVPRASPKSSEYDTGPTTGKINLGTPEPFGGAAARLAGPIRRRSATSAPRAVERDGSRVRTVALSPLNRPYAVLRARVECRRYEGRYLRQGGARGR